MKSQSAFSWLHAKRSLEPHSSLTPLLRSHHRFIIIAQICNRAFDEEPKVREIRETTNYG